MANPLDEQFAIWQKVPMKLSEYLTKTSMKPVQFARKAGLPPSTVYRLLEGARPGTGLDVLDKIEAASEGAVTPNDALQDFRDRRETTDQVNA